MLISSSIPNMVNGVSQQPFTLRLVSQAERQENGLSTASQGLKKRPPTKLVKKVTGTPIASNSFLHTINRDGVERYFVVIQDGSLFVLDINGNLQTVNFPFGSAYLSSANPMNDFRAVTVADYTFFLNKNVTVGQANTTTSGRPFETLIHVKQGVYGKTYQVLVNGVPWASYTTPDGGSASHSTSISTDFIASQLVGQIQTNLNWVPQAVTNVQHFQTFDESGAYYFRTEFNLPAGATTGNSRVYVDGVQRPFSAITGGRFRVDYSSRVNIPNVTSAIFSTAPGWAIAQYGSVIHLINTASDFTIETRDGFANNAMVALKRRVQRFSELPAEAGGAEGFAIEVVGDATKSGDNYWVEFTRSSNGTGSWRERPAPGVSNGFTWETMPHALIREANGTFTFRRLEWIARRVGDLETNPNPSFVGQKLNDIFFFRNRLGVLSGESVIFSEAGEFFNFFKTTASEVLDSDPIDIQVSHNKVATLVHAIPFNKELLLFSQQTQFTVESGDLLTPRTIAIKQTTEFECNINAKPVGVGRFVYFAVPKGNYSGIREYFSDSDTGVDDSSDITTHVPQYIPKNITRMAAALNEDMLCIQTSDEMNALYVYKFYWEGTQKLQSAWSKWVWPNTDTILHASFIESTMYLLVNRSDGFYIESCPVSLGHSEPNEPYLVHLDRKVTLAKNTHSYAVVGGQPRTFLAGLPFDLTGGSYMAVVATGQGKTAGTLLEILGNPGAWYVVGDYRDSDLIVGRKYSLIYELSPVTIRQQVGNAQRADTVGRLQLRNMWVNYASTGYFEAKVTPAGRQTYTYKFTGKTLGQPTAQLGTNQLQTGKFQFPVLSEGVTTKIELVSDLPLPVSFLSADWEGFYVKRSRGV